MTKNTPFISILIPVYNVSDYVQACVDSILQQIDDSVEVILLNDASTDDSLQKLQKYATHAQVLIINEANNSGLSGARNKLLTHAKGDYVWFIDSDDVMTDGAFKVVKSTLQNTQVDVLCGDYHKWESSGKKNQKKSFVGKANKLFFNHQSEFLDNIIKNNSNHVWSKVLRRSLIIDVPFKQGAKFEDIYFMSALSQKSFSFLYSKQVMIDYRQRQGSIVSSVNQQYVDDYLTAFIDRANQYHGNRNGYMYYKAYNRFAGLITELSHAQKKELFSYTVAKYYATFLEYYTLAHNCHQKKEGSLTWFHIKKIQKKHQKTLARCQHLL